MYGVPSIRMYCLDIVWESIFRDIFAIAQLDTRDF